MASKQLNIWLTMYDPIHRGWTPFGIANGLCTTGGFFFPRTGGGYNLYRAVGKVPDLSSELVGAAGADASRIRTFPWVKHLPDTQYNYRLVPVGGGGVENWSDQAVTCVAFNLAGDWIGRLPNAPTDLRVMALEGGRFAVRWTYLPQGQQIEPEGFRLYKTFEGVIDYGSTEGEIPYDPGRIHFEYISQAWPQGQRIGWAVRTYGPAGSEEQNTNHAFAFARSQAPPVNPAVMVTVL